MTLLRWAVMFFVISIVAALLGFGGIAEGSADIAKFLAGLFVVIAVVLFIAGGVLAKKVTG